jgi:hypothetical protein
LRCRPPPHPPTKCGVPRALPLAGSRGGAPRLALLLLALAAPAVAQARVLEVGPGRQYDRPSAAAAVAEDGDTVSIAPGEYFDCAIWRADHLTIVGEPGEPGAALTDAVCVGKGAFVIDGNGVTVRNLTFARIRVPDDNGAGIRGEGRDLTVQDSRFVNDQIGILGASPGGGFLRVVGCAFTEQGSSLLGKINYAVRATGYDLVHIERSEFSAARGGGHVSSDAGRTELIGNRLLDEGKHMEGPLVVVQAGSLLLDGNMFELAAGAPERPGVVLALGEAPALAVRGNTLRGDGVGETPLLRNWTGQDATVGTNTVPAGVEVATDSGITWHRVRATAAEVRDTVFALYHRARHIAAELVHRFG